MAAEPSLEGPMAARAMVSEAVGGSGDAEPPARVAPADEFDTFSPCPECGHVLAAHLNDEGNARPCAVYTEDERSNAPRYKFCACRRAINVMEARP